MEKAIRIFYWFITLMIVWTFVAALVSQPSDIAVVAGVTLGGIFFVVSYQTKCFTRFK